MSLVMVAFLLDRYGSRSLGSLVTEASYLACLVVILRMSQ